MNWQQIHITTTKEVAALVEDVLLELGSLAVTYQDAANQALFEPAPDETPLWDHVELTALFGEDADLTAVIATLSHQFPTLDCEVEYLADQEWERAWLKDFKPMQFGSNTWICPTGFDAPDPEAINILLDPGLAFGTGTHPTTALCLTWLDQNDIQGQTVIDYGCGSGILAIAALKHGASEVIAIDHDPQALIATRDNAERNNLDLR
ncbi:MAG: 50S ribosomal protein L11 methyltransferase, partial [Gammaproteobacteria bacterium]|nr:50S ribosomal protein L11 methyltransferase [Gammaproteobacteria bacterium]